MNGFDEKDLLIRELRERSGDVGGHPIDLDTVRHSAGRIRRRRTVVTGAVAAMVAAAALPAGLALTSGPTAPVGPAEQPSPSPSLSEAAPRPRPDGTFPLTLEGLPRGADPRVPYVLGGEQQLVTPEGTVDLPEAFAQITPYRGGWFALRGGENGWEAVTLTADLEEDGAVTAGASFVVSDDGTRVLWGNKQLTTAGDTAIVDDPTDSDDDVGQMTWRAPRDSEPVPVGFLGEHTGTNRRSVVFRTEGEEPLIAIGDDEGEIVPLQGFLSLRATSERMGYVAGLVDYSPDEVCHGVMVPPLSTTELLWRTCDYSLQEFSPDGRFVIAGAAYHDEPGSPVLAVLDARTGEVVVEFTPVARNTVVGVIQATWEDGDTVVAALVEGDEIGMLRAELDGRLEAVTDTLPWRDMDLPFWFAEVPRR